MAVVVGHGFEVVSEIKTKLSLQVAHQFYNEHVGKSFFETLTGYMSSGPIVGLHLRRPAAISAWRHLIGPTNLEKAKSERFDSIRAKFAFDGTRNAVHGSDSQASASRELAFFFSVGTFHSPPVATVPESNIPDPMTSSILDVTVGAPNKLSPIATNSKKLKGGPTISRNDIAKMQAYASEELNPIMTSLVRNLVVGRPKQVEDVAISKLTDIKYQRMMTGSVAVDSVASIQEQSSLIEQVQIGSGLEEDSVV
jgi:nucleoside diphosphate kinase